MTTFEMAQTLVRLGAVRGMQLDGGGSTTLAFDGKILNRPSDKTERPISNALMLFYYGVYAPPPLVPVVSPNGDGVAEEQALSFKVVRPSNVTDHADCAGRHVALPETAARAPGTYEVPFPPVPAPAPPPDPEPSAPAGAPEPPPAGRGPLDAQRELRRRPGPHLVGGSALRRELDARLPEAGAGAVGLCRRAARTPPSAGRRRARQGQGHSGDDRGRAHPHRRASALRARRAGGRLERPAGNREARGRRPVPRSRRGDERARHASPSSSR